MPWRIVAQSENCQSYSFRDDHEKRVLKKQRVAFDLTPIYELKEPCPKLRLRAMAGSLFALSQSTASFH